MATGPPLFLGRLGEEHVPPNAPTVGVADVPPASHDKGIAEAKDLRHHRSQHHLHMTTGLAASTAVGPRPQLLVRHTRTHTIDCPTDDVDAMLTAVAAKLGVPRDAAWLSYGGRVLRSGQSLRSYGVAAGATVHLAVRGRGGALSLAASVSARRLQRSQSRSLALEQAASSESARDEQADPWLRIRALERENATLRAELEQAQLEIQRLRKEHHPSPTPAGASAPANATPEPAPQLSPEQRAERDAIQSVVDAEEAQGQCSFFFVSADYILAQTTTTLPSFQELQRVEGVVVQRTLDAALAYRSHYASGELLAVSHRWEHKDEPDTLGDQLRAIQAHLRRNPRIRFVWYDYWCMPQGDRSPAERVHFGWMLKNVNFLYLGCSVLILLDISYLSRFWTQMEAWLSMQLGGTDGLRPAHESLRRCTIEFLHAVDSTTRSNLINMWAHRSPEEAYVVLSKPDVHVTNLSDKVTQLEKVRHLDPDVRTAFTPATVTQLYTEGATAHSLLTIGFSSTAVASAGITCDAALMDACASVASMARLPDVRTILRVTVLDFHGTDLSAEESQALALVLRHSAPELVRLDVSGGVADSRAVGEALLSRTTSKLVSVKCKAFEVPDDARELDVSGNKGLSAGDAFLLAGVMKFNAVITNLDTRYNSISGEAAQQLSSAVVASPSLEVFSEVPVKELRADSLTELNFSSKYLGPTEAIVIASLVEGSAVITSLDVGFNNLNEEAALSIVRVARQQDRMTNLGLAECEIGPTGAKEIAEYVSGSAVLTDLDLRSNNLGSQGAAAIAEALNSGMAVLKKLNLDGFELNIEQLKGIDPVESLNLSGKGALVRETIELCETKSKKPYMAGGNKQGSNPHQALLWKWR